MNLPHRPLPVLIYIAYSNLVSLSVHENQRKAWLTLLTTPSDNYFGNKLYWMHLSNVAETHYLCNNVYLSATYCTKNISATYCILQHLVTATSCVNSVSFYQQLTMAHFLLP